MISIEYTPASKADPVYQSKAPAIIVKHLIQKGDMVDLLKAFIDSAGPAELRDALDRAGYPTGFASEDTGKGNYYVSVDGGKAPEVRHYTPQAALQEAERLAKKTPGTMVRVLKQVGYRKATQTVTLEGEPK